MSKSLEEILTDPDEVGAAEYRAIHELLVEAEDIDAAIAIADEFKNYGQALGQRLRRHRSEERGNSAEGRAVEPDAGYAGIIADPDRI